jgi:hypothetical protein
LLEIYKIEKDEGDTALSQELAGEYVKDAAIQQVLDIKKYIRIY